MNEQTASIIIGNIPIPKDDENFTPKEYQQAKAMAVDALIKSALSDVKTTSYNKDLCACCVHFKDLNGHDDKCNKDPSLTDTPQTMDCLIFERDGGTI